MPMESSDLMPRATLLEEMSDTVDASELRQQALSRWENEGGAGACGPRISASVGDTPSDVATLTDSEQSQLHIT
jgi:hypothetical protein